MVTPLVFNKLFFPNFDPLVGTLLAYTTFFVGFISRPVGGIIFGHYGDRIGRKTVLVLTILIMGLATFLIGLLPTYASAGIWAPIMLLFLRVFQGIGIGGEWGGAVLMAVEHSPAGRRGFYGSWPQIGVPAGLLLSSGMVYLLSYLPEADFFSWGWRIAFLISALLVAVGVYIRLKIMETPAFTRIQESNKLVHVPFFELWRTHGKNTLLGLGARYIEGVTFNIFGVFIVGYIAGTLGLPRQTALAGVMIASAIMIIMLPIYGNLSDKIGRRRMFGVAGLLIGILSFPAFWLMQSKDPLLIWIAIAVPFAIVYPGGVRPAGRLVLRTVRYARSLYRNIIRLPILRHLRERANTYHRYRAAAHGEQPALADLCLCAGRQRYQCALGVRNDRGAQARHGRRQQMNCTQTATRSEWIST